MTPAIVSSNNETPASGSRGALWALGVSLAASLLMVAPFFWWGSASGHDFEFHLSSWLDVAGQWKTGILFPRWNEWANHGFGEPRFLFYPPLSWLLGAALSLIVPWVYTPVAFIVLVQTFAGYSAFTLVRRMVANRAAVFGAFVYAANPNALLMIYRRSDYAELLACSFFPLVVLTALQLAGTIENRCNTRVRALVAFAVTYAAVWLSNAPAGVIITYSVAVLFGFAAFAERSWWPLAGGVAAMAFCFGLAGFYLVPAIYEQRWVNINEVLSSGLRPDQNFLYTMISDPEHNIFNIGASSLAVGVITMTGIAAIAARRAVSKQRWTEWAKTWQVLVLVSAVATALMLRPTLFLWKLLPKLWFVQFPWRWMSIPCVTLALFLAMAAMRPRLRWLWITAIVTGLFVLGTRMALRAWWDADDIPTIQAGIAAGKGFDGMDEYDPIGDDHYNLPEEAPRTALLPGDEYNTIAPESTVRVEKWTAEVKELNVTSRKPLKVALRLLMYPAWQTEVNGRAVRPERTEDIGQMVIAVPAGESRISVRFARTWDRTLGFLLTLVSVAAAMALFFWPDRS